MTAFLIALFIGLSFGIVAYAVCRFLIWWVDVDGRNDKDNPDKFGGGEDEKRKIK